MAQETPTLAELWVWLRSDDFLPFGAEIVKTHVPVEMQILSVTHVRTGHYAAYKVETVCGSWLVRVGLASPSDSQPADNSAYRGTSAHSPTGQEREYTLAQFLAASNVDVVAPAYYGRIDPTEANGASYDVLWIPFLDDEGSAITASQWYDVLSPLHKTKPLTELPVFTNRDKTMARLKDFPDRGLAKAYAQEYDTALTHLFDVATHWGIVHGDAHSENILISRGVPVLFDFDTVCWAPTVWDLTHLLTRVGIHRNTGYTVEELKAAFHFTDEEVDAALLVRSIATKIARAFAEIAEKPTLVHNQ